MFDRTVWRVRLAHRHAPTAVVVILVGFVAVLTTLPPLSALGAIAIGALACELTRASMIARTSAREAELSAILDSTADGLIVIDEEGRIRLFNAAAGRIFQYAPEDVLGRNVDMLVPESHSPSHRRYLARYLETGEAHVLGKERETEGLRSDGTTFPMALRVREMRGAGEPRRPRAFVGVVQDVTERKSLEVQLRQAQKMDAVGQLAGGIAHDFNNLLTIIIGVTDELLVRPDTQLTADVRRDLERVLKAGGRAAGLTKQLLAFSRKQVVRPTVLNLNHVVSQLASMLRRLIGENIALATELAADLGNVRTDAGQIEQVLVNLAVNARDAMPLGGTLTIETVHGTETPQPGESAPAMPAGHVCIVVSDTGHGMTPDVQARIFEPFFTTKERGKGTGLGLSTVYGIVRQHGGSIAVESQPGTGTTFRICFPRVDAPVTEADPPRESPGRQGWETVLLVDDDLAVTNLASRALTRAGYTVLEAQGGREALAVAEQYGSGIHLLLTDVVMHGISGRELAEALRARLPALRVVFMSGYTDDALARHGVLDPGVIVLEKPFTGTALVQLVRRTLDAGAPARAGSVRGALPGRHE